MPLSRRATAILLVHALLLSSVQPGLWATPRARGKLGPLQGPAPGALARVLLLPAPQALPALSGFQAGTLEAQAAYLIEGLAVFQGEAPPELIERVAKVAEVSPAELERFVSGLAAAPEFAGRVAALREELSGVASLEGLVQGLGELYGAKPLSADPVFAGPDEAAAAVARALFADVIRKYSDIAELAPSAEAAISEIAAWEPAELEAPLGELLDRLARKQVPEAAERLARVDKALSWLRRKYGVLDRRLLSLAGPLAQGSYQTPGTVRFSLGPARLPKVFDPAQESSIQDLDAYIGRKWGGLSGIASPERVIFSELGTTDTLAGLRRQGFERFHFVNGPYASRGSKTLLAWKAGESAPQLVFYSFVGRDLLNHKLMQVALQYGARFQEVRVLGSDSLKSWEVADLVVTRALAGLPERRIDDLVVGYGDEVKASLLRHGGELETAWVGDFARITYFSVRGENGLDRTVAVLTDVELRYFGKSVLALVKPFLSRRIDRVIFAGSAGSLDPAVPLHGLVIPRGFHALEEAGGVGPRLAVDNDLFDLLPYGQSWSGRHLSVPSPLVESREMVRRLREQAGILSVDVEGAQLAEMIARHNALHGERVRFGAAFLVTDTPVAQGEAAKKGYGLGRPDFKKKAEAKKNYAAAVALLWGLPDRHKPSHHTKRIGRHYAARISALKSQRDAVGLAALAREIEDRLAAAQALSRGDRRVSRGLGAAYRDLLRAIEKEGVAALGQLPPPEPATSPQALPPPLQRAIILQSLTRSSTLSSGEVAFKTELPAGALLARAAANAERAVDYLLARLDWPLELSDILRISALLNEGIGQDPGRPRDFSYRPEEGPERGSQEELEAFGEWLASVRPTPEAALEAALRLEELHPFGDANGRVSELVAQHMMLRAAGHPLLFPHRFDIDHILSLRRNGSGPRSDLEHLSRLLRRSAELSSWLSRALPGAESARASMDRETGHVALESGGARYELVALFKARQAIELERESRIFLEPGAEFEGYARRGLPPARVLRLPHAEYELALALYPARLERPAEPARPEIPAGPAPAGVLSFGGSFSPPTLEHMGLLTQLMHRLGFTRAKMVVAYPYKAGAAPPEVSLDLTRVAVENLSEALAINGLPYRGFSSWDGGSSWIGAGGKRYAVSVEDYDIRTRNKENALQTIEHLRRAHGGDPKANYWLAGADSFGSVASWTPRWRELFEHSNWLVVARPGYPRLDFKKPDPLRGLLGDDFLSQYLYSFDAARRMHAYAHQDPKRPGIYIVDQPTLGDSSTGNRESLARDAEREHAQAGLQPSVFKRAVLKGYYAGTGAEPGYTALTEKNLDIYTAQLFDRIAVPGGERVSAEEARDYERLSSELVRAAKAQTQEESGRPWWRRAAGAAAEHVGEFFENILSIPKFRKKLRELYEKVGRQVAAIYLFGELILEPIIAPLIAFFIGGAAAAAVAPFLHVNEFFVMPAYFAYRLARHLKEQRRLAGGELGLYRHLKSYRRRLARGDPEAIAARVELGGGLALGGAPMTLNIVRSQLPKWVPLAIRRFFDRRIVWHDLNVSINELKAALQDKALAARLSELAGRRRGLLGHRLLAAIQEDPAAKARLELSLASRYFQRLSLGEVDEQLVGGFTPAERGALMALRAQAEGYRRALLPGQLAELSELAADFYALSRALASEPARTKSDAFWTAFLDMMLTRYPDERLSLSRGADRAVLARRLPILIRMAERALPGALAGATITYRGRALAEVRGSGAAFWIEGALKRAAVAAQGQPSTTAAVVRARTLESAAVEYATANAGLFAGASGAPGLRLLATSSRGDDLDRANLVWEMDLLRNRVERELSVLSAAYARAEKQLEQRRPAKGAARVFWDAREMIEVELEGLGARLRVLEYDWLKLKFPHQVGAAARDERLIEGYPEIAARYEALRAEHGARLEAYRALKDMMFGTQPAPVEDFESLREAIWRRMGPGKGPNLLGYGLLRRFLARLASALAGGPAGPVQEPQSRSAPL